MSDETYASPNRPSPDALLDKAAQDMRGRLKIFLGAAPGVGKTCEMLRSGHTRRIEGADVVIGLAETHGRRDTAALLDGFEIIPRAHYSHKGQQLAEMDLDAILTRRPALVLVDELAHSNAPGSRHPKRYMDVEELLDRGIDVYTTLNIQHIESLNDVVAQITRIRVRETVPDYIIDRADDVEIIDLTPSDLIKRLRDGKVYPPGTARRAIENYFSEGNLTALRELALRRTAQRVDDQLVSHMQAHAIDGPWAAGERVLVCIDPHPRSASLVRYTRRHADRARAEWTALHIETPRSVDMSQADKTALAAHLRLTEQLGGHAVSLSGQQIAAEIIRYAEARNFTQIIIGKPSKPQWRELLEGSVSRDLIRNSGAISIHVIAGTKPAEAEKPGRIATAAPARSILSGAYVWGSIYVACAVGLGMVLDKILFVQNLAMVFLLAILTTAVTAGFWPAIYVSVASALAFNYFFLPPVYTFTVSEPESVIALGVFLVVGITASNLTSGVQRQARAAQMRARMTDDLNQFSRKLAGTGTLDDVLWATAFQIASMLKLRVVLLLPQDGTIVMKAGYPPDDTLVDADIAAARWAWENDRPAGRGADTLPGAKRLYLPIRTGRGPVGVVGLDSDRPGPLLRQDQQRLFDALTDQAAVAIERIQLVAAVDRAKRLEETDRLRSALLTSISHDLKTPLAGILGAAGTLRDYADALSDPDRGELLATVIDESERLNGFIANLLDMTRIDSGALRPNSALYDVSEIVGAALRRADKLLHRHLVQTDLDADLPMVLVDPVLFEQVLFNLLDNAAKYAPAASRIVIRCWADDRTVTVQVMDEGGGFPADDTERLFDSFYRVRKQDNVQAGTGLGLAICRGFVEAMDGTITASNRTDRPGAIFTVRLPVTQGAFANGPDR